MHGGVTTLQGHGVCPHLRVPVLTLHMEDDVGLDGAHGVGSGAAVLPGVRPLHLLDGESAGADQHPRADAAPHFAPGDVGTGFSQAQALQLHCRPCQHRLHCGPDVDQGPGESLEETVGFWGEPLAQRGITIWHWSGRQGEMGFLRVCGTIGVAVGMGRDQRCWSPREHEETWGVPGWSWEKIRGTGVSVGVGRG